MHIAYMHMYIVYTIYSVTLRNISLLRLVGLGVLPLDSPLDLEGLGEIVSLAFLEEAEAEGSRFFPKLYSFIEHN